MCKKFFLLVLFISLSTQAAEALPKEPSLNEIEEQLPTLSGYDGFALFCVGGDIYSILAIKQKDGYFIKKTKLEGQPCTQDTSKKFVLEPLH